MRDRRRNLDKRGSFGRRLTAAITASKAGLGSCAEDDWHDIRLLIRAAREQHRPFDWELITDYLGIFHLNRNS